ncbi:hypothetical protein [Streptomyces pactum]|uniref:hypothetical protein n=1 Tax=Streptomyces pactum TaxID=68249 RepID=UPI0036FD411F
MAVSRYQNSKLSQPARLQWAAIAARAIDEKYRDDAGDAKLRCTERGFVVAYLIAQFGPSAHHPLRDPCALFEEIMGTLGTQPEAALKAAENWRQHDVARVRELRRIKNLLKVLEYILPYASTLDTAGIAAKWTAVRPALP